MYTQTSDVEDEISGWMTYDRKVSKLPETTFAALHEQFFKPTMTGKFILPLLKIFVSLMKTLDTQPL